MPEKVSPSKDLPFIIKPRKNREGWDDDPDDLEKAVSDGRFISDISLDVIKCLNGIFRNEVSDAGSVGFRFLFKELPDKPVMERYEVAVTEGMEIEVKHGQSIGVTLREKIPHVDRTRAITKDIKKFGKGLEIMHGIRNHLVRAGFGQGRISGFTSIFEGEALDDEQWQYELYLDKLVDIATPKIAAAEMTKVLKALGVEKKRGKKK